MKTTDLMIGDYITFAESLNDEQGPLIFQVVALNCPGEGEALMLLKGEKACDEMEIDDEWSGIPITPAILERNGFVNDSYYNECVADGKFVQVQIWAYREDNILIDWDGYTLRVVNDFGHPCEDITLQGSICVHELQHALRLCGIKKEVVL